MLKSIRHGFEPNPEAEKEASYHYITKLSMSGYLIMLVYGLEIKEIIVLTLFAL